MRKEITSHYFSFTIFFSPSRFPFGNCHALTSLGVGEKENLRVGFLVVLQAVSLALHSKAREEFGKQSRLRREMEHIHEA
jgi:hypothetical protein